MRKVLFISALGLLFSKNLKAQDDGVSIEGNGKLVTREVPVRSFDALEASGVYELKIIQGNKESVKIEADENLQNLFVVANKDGKLVIDTKNRNIKNLATRNKMRVYVTFQKLKSIELSTVGNVESENQLTFDDVRIETKSVGNIWLALTADKIDIDNKAIGNMELTGKAESAIVKNKGVGNLKASELVVQTMDIENNGVGNADVNAEKTIKVTDSFLGKVKNRGAATIRKMNKVEI